MVLGAGLSNVLAAWNINGGGNGVGANVPGGGSANWKYVSPYANGWLIGVRFSLVYYDGSNYNTLATKDFWSATTSVNYYFGEGLKYGNKILGINTTGEQTNYKYTNYQGNPFFNNPILPEDNCTKIMGKTDYSILKGNGLFYCNSGFPNVFDANKIFRDEENKKYLQDNMGDWFGYSYDFIRGETAIGKHKSSVSMECTTNSRDCKGYRILMEPIEQFIVNNNNNKLYSLTLSQAAQLLQNGMGVTEVDTSRGIGQWLALYSKMIYTTTDDIGIKSGASYSGNEVVGLADNKIGLGLNIIDPSFGEANCDKVNKKLQNSNDVIISLVWREISRIKETETLQKTKFLEKYASKLKDILYSDDTVAEKWTYEQYANQCLVDKPSNPGNPQNKYDCTPKFNVGSCNNGNSVSYTDQNNNDFWNKCVYNDEGYYSINTHKVSKPNSTSSLSYYDNTLGGKYCEVYCTEEITTNFNSTNINVYAGKHFTWTNHTVNGSRTCKTKNVDWTTYTNDINSANANVIDKYGNYRLEQELATISWVRSSTPDCNYYCDHNNGATCCISGHTVSGCTPWETKDKDGKVTGSGCSPWSYYVCDSYDTPYYHSYMYYPNNTSSVTKNFWTKSRTVSATCGGQGYYPNVAGKLNEYQNSLIVAAGVTNEMKKCYEWNETNIYNLNPQLNISYSDNTYSYSGNLNTNTRYNSVQSDNKCETITVPNYTTCSTTGCTSTGTMEKCEYSNKTRSGTASFSYSEAGIYQYVLKQNNKSIHVWELNNYKTGNITPNYIDIGYSNFPVAYKTPDGVYGFGQPKGGDLSLTYYRLGHMKSGSTYIDSILSTSDINKNDDYNKWRCKFTVNSKLIPGNPDDKKDHGGIKLIYRPIDLSDPFPGSNGKGRNTGENWCYFGLCNNNNKNVQDYITNNRGVKTDEIYSKTPMYTFTLTPAIIKEIRKYNNQNNYAEYTGTLGGDTFDYVCGEGTGKTCISEYLSHLIEITDAKNKPGTCSLDNTRNSKDSTSFENCRK